MSNVSDFLTWGYFWNYISIFSRSLSLIFAILIKTEFKNIHTNTQKSETILFLKVSTLKKFSLLENFSAFYLMFKNY